MAGGFRDLNIWKKGYELVMQVYKLTSNYPFEEKFGLVDQTRRSASSVIALVAEAHGRYHYADKCRVLYQSRGECEETQSHLSVALGLEYISGEEFKDLDGEYEGLSKGINSYIGILKKNKT